MIPQSMKNQISKDVLINGKSLHTELFRDDDILGEASILHCIQHLGSADNSIASLHLWE